MTQEYIGTKQVTAWESPKDGVAGYAVKYEDGYTSWSPKDTFEKAYVAIGHVKHLGPRVQQMIGEKAQNDDRLEKLKAFMTTQEFSDLPRTTQVLLGIQAEIMEQLSGTLGELLA